MLPDVRWLEWSERVLDALQGDRWPGHDMRLSPRLQRRVFLAMATRKHSKQGAGDDQLKCCPHVSSPAALQALFNDHTASTPRCSLT